MNNLVIVAIPSEDDYVWKLSSEKVPHMTILFLGESEQANVPQIADFLEHAVSTSVERFGMEVDHRGTLGPDQADVLFFSTDYNDWIVDFRSQLLKDTEILKAYSSVPQYEEYTPHLTMGYPDTPAKEDTREYPGIHWVNFDKIALWFGDYQGLEFPLKQPSYGDVAGWSAIRESGETAVDNILHFGVKGMHWGVRKERAPVSRSVDSAKAAKAKKKLKEKGVHSLSNEEIRNLTQRIELEKRMKDVSPGSGKSALNKINKGHNAVKSVLAIGTTLSAAYAFSQSPVGKAIASGVTKKVAA